MKVYIVGYNAYGGGLVQAPDGAGYFLLNEEEIEAFIADAPESRGVEFWVAESFKDLIEALKTGRRQFRSARLIASVEAAR